MNFNTHSDLAGLHAYLSPSKYHWIGYDEEHLENSYSKFLAVQKGTEYHELACQLIRLNIKLPKSKKSLNQFVNDAIGYRMQPEQPLFYSENFFGTTDAISFREGVLRIHDLKTGVTPTSMKQLEIYAALFCLEYKYRPADIDMELRIYQLDDVVVHVPQPEEIGRIMNKAVAFDKMITKLKQEEG